MARRSKKRAKDGRWGKDGQGGGDCTDKIGHRPNATVAMPNPESLGSRCLFNAMLLAAASLAAPAAWAQQDRPAAPAPDAASWSAGFFVSSETSPYRGADRNNRALPLLAFENAHVRLAGPIFDVKLPFSGAVAYTLRARYTDTGYTASDSAALVGMAERKSSFWLGGKAEWKHPLGRLSAEWLGDASNHSDGQQIRLTAEKPVQMGRFALAPRAGLIWQDSNYVDYHFGVRSNEAMVGRQAYRGRSAINTELGLRALYFLTRQQSLFADVSVTALGASIKDSPLVDRRWVSAVRAGYAYRF